MCGAGTDGAGYDLNRALVNHFVALLISYSSLLIGIHLVFFFNRGVAPPKKSSFVIFLAMTFSEVEQGLYEVANCQD